MLSLAQAPPAASAPSFDRANAQLVAGSSLSVRVAGGVPPYVIVPSSSNFDVDFDPQRDLLTITAQRNGRGTVTVLDSSGASASLPVLVAPPAGIVPARVSLTLAGDPVSIDYATAQISAALLRGSHLANGASLSSGTPSFAAPLRPGTELDARLPVLINGNNNYVDVAGSSEVHVRVVNLPRFEPSELMYSDDPENLPAADDGVLFRDSLGNGASARLYLYHATLVPDRHLTLALRAIGGPARVQLLGSAAGPSSDYMATGHAATVQYLRAHRAGNSLVLDIEPGAPFLLPLSAQPLQNEDLIASIFDLRVLAGGPVDVVCIATTDANEPAALLDAPRVPGDGHLRTGTFALDAPLLALALRAGDPEPAPLSVGMPKVTPLRAPRSLDGGYGVLQRLTISLENPLATASDVYLYEIPSGNAVTSSFYFDGDAAPLEVPCVKTAGTRYLVRRFSLAPGERFQTSADYMTDGASSYPIELGLTTTPPQAPNNCGAASTPAASE